MCEEISIEMKHKCYQLCAQYLCGVWKHIREDNMIFKRIIGGITNQMFYCSLPSAMVVIDSEPKEVAIKVYRSTKRPLETNDSIMNDIIIGLIISENGLGPKIYGISSDAVIMQYIQCHQFNCIDQKNSSIVSELGRKLAKVHSLNPPINRSLNWFYVTFNEKNINSYKNEPINGIIVKNKLKYFIENDFEKEFKLLEKLVIECESPIVFSHNDFGFNNILVKDWTQSNDTNDKIVLSDFEFSSYGFRGRDFGIVFDDWLDFNELDYEENCETIINPFLKCYFDESARINGKDYVNDKNNTSKHLLNEAKIFLLLQKMFPIVYHLNELVLNENIVNIMKNANTLFGRYLSLKNRLIKENVINS